MRKTQCDNLLGVLGSNELTPSEIKKEMGITINKSSAIVSNAKREGLALFGTEVKTLPVE